MFTKKYRLSILFGSFAVVMVSLTTVLIVYTTTTVAEKNLIRIAEQNTAADAAHILSMVSDQQSMLDAPSTGMTANTDEMKDTAGATATDMQLGMGQEMGQAMSGGMDGGMDHSTSEPKGLALESLAGPNGLPMTFPMLVAGFTIERLSLLGMGGQVIWSTDLTNRGGGRNTSPLYGRALTGELASQFVPEVELVDLDGKIRNIPVVETYVPLRGSSDQIIGAMRIDRDVTDDVQFLIGSTKAAVLKKTGALMSGLFVALFTVVLLADKAIIRSKRAETVALDRELNERERAAKELGETNGRLEDTLAELERTQKENVRQERLRALGQMASGIAHDFNNALTPILGFSELLLSHPEKLGNEEIAKQHLEHINMAAQDAAEVVSRLRDFYRHRDGEEAFDPVDPNEIVGQVISLTQAKWKDEAQARGITLKVHTDLQEVPHINASESELREALANLTLNAVDAMPDGGTITFRTRREGQQVVLQVSDTGGGMPEEVRQRAFDPFFTTKGPLGSGMGLATVYGTVQRHHGLIDIESALGIGTTVTIRLPVLPIEPNQTASVSLDSEREHPLHVLVADDEPSIRELLIEYLSEDGHSVETATNGCEALEKFRTGTFDLVITDRAMPEMSGDQLAAAIKQEVPGTPTILLTGFADIMAATDDRPEGVEVILGKPVTPGQLQKAVSEVMAGVSTGAAAG